MPGRPEKTTAGIGFEQQIWAAADILRGNIDASEYKHVVLGLIFRWQSIAQQGLCLVWDTNCDS